MRLLHLIVFSFLAQPLVAQRQALFDTENWLGVMTSGQIAPNWSLWVDMHHVPDLFLILRSGLTHHTSDHKWAVTAGYAHTRLAAPFSDGKLIRPEHRPWGQVVFRVPSNNRFSTSFRIRYDARFRANLSPTEITDGFSLNHRLRFNNSLRYNWRHSLSRHFNFSTTLFNESLITTGPAPVNNPFEHRVFFLLGIQKSWVTVSPGYHIRFTTPSPHVLQINHGFTLWINFNYKFRDFKRESVEEFPEDHI